MVVVNRRHRVDLGGTGGGRETPHGTGQCVGALSPEKAGRDAGEIVRIGPIGVAATNDADALIALRPTAWCMRPADRSATPAPCSRLRPAARGRHNVVSTTTNRLIYPDAFGTRSLAR